MSFKTKVLAAAAVLTLAGGAGLAGATSTASAATPSCGSSCVNTYPQEYAGQSLQAPQNVLDVYRQGEKVGQPVILFRSSNADPAEDWTVADQGPASDFYAAGLLSPVLALHYGCTPGAVVSINGSQVACSPAAQDETAYQLEYAPFGVESGLCMGIATTAAAGVHVALEPCGVSSKTVWLQDTTPNDKSPSAAGFWAAVNGSGTSFSDPAVLTYPSGANPVDRPRVQLVLENLAQFSNGPTFDDDSQLWTAFQGVLP
jgi:hypothetical protein